MSALKQLKSCFHTDLTAAADDDITLDLGLMEKNVLSGFGLFDARDGRNKRSCTGCKDDMVCIYRVDILLVDGSVELYLNIAHATKLHTKEFGNVVENIPCRGNWTP